MYSLVLTEYNYYYIDNFGNLFRLVNNTFKAKKPRADKRGYIKYEVNLGKNRQRKTVFQHRLIAKAFIPNPENKPTVDHINRNPSDNRLENLRWATYREQRVNSNAGRKKGCKNNPYKYCSKRIFPHILKPITT